jgi:hypothetical protein
MRTNAKEFHQNKLRKTSPHRDLMNTLISRTCQKLMTGEMSMEPIGCHGPETNTFLNTVEVVGLMDLQVQLLTESTLSETEHGQT